MLGGSSHPAKAWFKESAKSLCTNKLEVLSRLSVLLSSCYKCLILVFILSYNDQYLYVIHELIRISQKIYGCLYELHVSLYTALKSTSVTKYNFQFGEGPKPKLGLYE